MGKEHNRPLIEIDHQHLTPDDEFFSCHTGKADEREPREPYVQIGNEEVSVATLRAILAHAEVCPLLNASVALEAPRG
jgi:hypothetical protein